MKRVKTGLNLTAAALLHLPAGEVHFAAGDAVTVVPI